MELEEREQAPFHLLDINPGKLESEIHFVGLMRLLWNLQLNWKSGLGGSFSAALLQRRGVTDTHTLSMILATNPKSPKRIRDRHQRPQRLANCIICREKLSSEMRFVLRHWNVSKFQHCVGNVFQVSYPKMCIFLLLTLKSVLS
jgi:hypothetical protein